MLRAPGSCPARTDGRGARQKPAIPLDPIDGIIAAFRKHKVVALAEGEHGNEQGMPCGLPR
jgi:hypothetical protein